MTDPATVPRNTELSLPVVETFHSLQGEGLHAGRSAFFIRLAGCSVGCSWCDTRHSWQAEDHPRRSLQELEQELAGAAAAGAAFAVLTGGEPLEHDLGPLYELLAAAAVPLPLHLETSGADPVVLSGRFAWITLSPKRHRPPTTELLAACDELKVVVHEPADLAFAEAMAAQALAARAATAPGCEPHPAGADGQQRSPASHGLAAGGAMAQAVAARPPMTRQDRANDQSPVATGDGDWSFALPVPATRPGPALLLQPGWNCRRGQELAVEFVRSHPAWRLSLQSHKWLGVR